MAKHTPVDNLASVVRARSTKECSSSPIKQKMVPYCSELDLSPAFCFMGFWLVLMGLGEGSLHYTRHLT